MLDTCCHVLAGSRERLSWRLKGRPPCQTPRQSSFAIAKPGPLSRSSLSQTAQFTVTATVVDAVRAPLEPVTVTM